jgi:adenylylsulfate kinase
VDRSENIRRAGEVARLMADAGVNVVCAFVSPFAADRQRVRALFEPAQFIEIFLSTSVDECARRILKGLSAKAKTKAGLRRPDGWNAPMNDLSLLNLIPKPWTSIK